MIGAVAMPDDGSYVASHIRRRRATRAELPDAVFADLGHVTVTATSATPLLVQVLGIPGT
jgi:hypothetical protein